MNRQEVIEIFLKKNYLVSPDFFDEFDGNDEFISHLTLKEEPIVLTKDLFSVFQKNKKIIDINWLEFERSRLSVEKGRDSQVYQTFLDILNYGVDIKRKKVLDTIAKEITQPEKEVFIEKDSSVGRVVIVKNYIEEKVKKREVSNFVQYFQLRYSALKDILSSRIELQNSISINKILNRKERQAVSVIGIVQDKKITKNGHILITLEDPTGTINVLVAKNREAFLLAEDLVFDEVIGVTGVSDGGFVFVDAIYLPDVPLDKEAKKCVDDVCVAFISDIHVGSTNFLEKEFLYFISWLNGNSEDKREKEFAEKIKYLFIVGDVVDGIGVYPGQEKNVTIYDVVKQYDVLAGYLDMIRKDISIILCPGDHDAVRLSHPQPPLHKEYAHALWTLPHVTLVANPSLVTIHTLKDFPGFDVLLYHGHGYHYYIDVVESLRKKRAVHHPRYFMKFFLQKRHLAPSHTSTSYIPDAREDPLVISRIPDIFVSGHLHKCDVDVYRNVITINCSCWQSITDFELKTGNVPDPCKVPILNLMTREIIIKEFNL